MRRSKRRRVKKLLLKLAIALCALSCLAVGGVFARQLWKQYYQLSTIDLRFPTPGQRSARAVYPYSVIPGGVRDPQELAASMSHDPVVRRHYEGIRAESLWSTRTSRPMLVYVSYRKGDAVQWTSHEVTIPAGELVLTDGTNMVRGRCGNRIAFKRPTPLPAAVAPVPEPPPDVVFETPLPGLVPSSTEQALPEASVMAKVEPAIPQLAPAAPVTPVWCCAEPQTPSQPGTPASVPEPGTLALFGTGCAAAAALIRRRRR